VDDVRQPGAEDGAPGVLSGEPGPAGGDPRAGAPAPPAVFVGVTGASGAPYAVRLLAALHALGCPLQVCVSEAGRLVVAHELGLPGDDPEAAAAGLLARAGAAGTVYRPDALWAPPASGSAAPDAVVVCPCSMSTAAHVALGTGRNLIHRAADVALKERRRLVVVPREAPLSVVHLRRLLELAEAGAVVLPAAPGFYHRPRSLDDLVDHVVGKVVASLGLSQGLFPPWDGGRT